MVSIKDGLGRKTKRELNYFGYTFGKFTSLIERKISTPSSVSGYRNLRFPAAVSTDLTARIP